MMARAGPVVWVGGFGRGSQELVGRRPEYEADGAAWLGKVDIMTNKNVFGDFIDYCADNMFPEYIAREKMAERARRQGNR